MAETPHTELPPHPEPEGPGGDEGEAAAEPPSPRAPGRSGGGGRRRSRGRRVAWLLLLLLLIPLALVVVIVGGSWLGLHIAPVQRFAARIAAERVTELLQGKLKVGSVEVTGGLRVCLRDVELSDPETGPVLTADRACVSLAALALARRDVAIGGISLERPVADIATVTLPDGTKTTTLARALKARKITPKEDRPFEWVIDVADLDLTRGSLTLRPAPGAKPSLQLSDLTIKDAKARYSQQGALAKLGLTGQLAIPGPLAAAVDLDATLDGSAKEGKLRVAKLRAAVGETGLTASGDFDLGTRAGKLDIAALRVRPQDVEALRAKLRTGEARAAREVAPLLSGEITGKGRLDTDGRSAHARLSLRAATGRIELDATSTLAAKPEWKVNLEMLGVDPGGLAARAPKGQVTIKLAARGNGIPSYDEHGVLGDFDGKLHVGPAHLANVGELKLDLDAKISGRKALVRAFTAAGLGLQISAHGTATADEVDLFVQTDAPNLRTVARAIGALRKKPAPNISGAARLYARVRGKPLHPDAEVHLRAPELHSGDVLDVVALSIDGALRGDLRNPEELAPKGNLTLVAQEAHFGRIELLEPSMRAELRWPAADVNMTAGVLGGKLDFRGKAELDDDRDGVRIQTLTVSYPGNELHLRHPISVHFADKATIVDPFWLEGDHGGIGVAATVYKPRRKGETSTVDGIVQLTKFDLAALPQFVLPPDLDLRGLVSGKVVVDGRLPRPEVDAHLELRQGGIKRVQGVDLDIFAHLIRNRLTAEVKGEGPAGVHIALKADAPLGRPKDLPGSAPLNGEFSLRGLDIEQAVAIAGNEKLARRGLRGTLGVMGAFEGTLGAPRLTMSADLSKFHVVLPKKGEEAAKAEPEQPTGMAKGLSSATNVLGAAAAATAPAPAKAARVTDADVHLGVWLERGMVAVDGHASLAGARPVTLLAQAPFDLMKALRDPAYLKGAMERPVRATVTASQLDLQHLADLGLVPEDTAGKVTASVDLDGTLVSPLLSVTATAQDLGKGRYRGLGGTVKFEVDEQVRLQLGVNAGEDVLGRLDLTLGVSGTELVEIQELRDPKKMARRIADRPVFGELDVPGLFVGRVSRLAGREKLPAEGRLVGKVHLEGTPAEPRITGRLALQDVHTQLDRKLGNAEVFVEGGPDGAVVHLGINPPDGGALVAHATLKADLTARAILQGGLVGVLQGELSGRLTAKKLDLKFLGGTHPYLRRAGGILDCDVEAHGLLASPETKGKASLRGGLFDIVGQGVFHNVAFDAAFTPKEVVLDRLVGQLGPGTFSAVLVAMSRTPKGLVKGEQFDRVEFTGEIHMGDDESVRDRKGEAGEPLQKAPLPFRQGGEERVRVMGEIDLFGHFENGTLVATAKIPNADVHVVSTRTKKLPSLKPHKDVLMVKPGARPLPPGVELSELEAAERARRTARFRAQVALDIERIYVHAEDFEFPVRSQLNFEYDARRPDKPTADGTITVPNGSYTALGKRLQIENAVITETGGDITNPDLEVKARYEKSGTTVFITVSGSAKDPVVDLQSNPPMDQDAIAFFLATGRVQGRATQGGGGIDLQRAGSSIVGSWLWDGVRKELADVLPVQPDVLAFETQGAALAQATVGKYLGDSFFIGYRYRNAPAPNENKNEGVIEYEISRSITAEANVGERQSDVSILWSKDF